MNTVRIVREYSPGEYCASTRCEFYREGRFGDECALCQAFAYYLWLKENGFRLLMVVGTPTKDG